MNKEQVIAQDAEYYMPVFSRYPIVLSHGEGPYVYDTEGKRYLDFLAGIAVNILGHNHPQLTRAISDQAQKMIHISNLYYSEPQAALAASLAKLSGLDKVFVGNTGAEANEGAIKLARKYGKRISSDKVEIVTAEHSFHGRTLATLTATAQPKYQQGYEPLPGGFRYVAYNDMAALEAAVSEKTCAVMLEPIQGEGGINIPADDYLYKVRQLCDRYGALLILDEIQTGMGRTGKLFAYQHTNVMPDIVTMAKGLGGGVPIGAFLAKAEVASAFHAGDHGTTFGGNPLACAAANAVLAAMENEKLTENAAQVGEYFIGRLQQLADKHSALVREVRGKGLMIGVKLTKPGKDVVARCMEKGAIINCTNVDVLRFVPPLNIEQRHVDEMVDILELAFAEA